MPEQHSAADAYLLAERLREGSPDRTAHQRVEVALPRGEPAVELGQGRCGVAFAQTLGEAALPRRIGNDLPHPVNGGDDTGGCISHALVRLTYETRSSGGSETHGANRAAGPALRAGMERENDGCKHDSDSVVLASVVLWFHVPGRTARRQRLASAISASQSVRLRASAPPCLIRALSPFRALSLFRALSPSVPSKGLRRRHRCAERRHRLRNRPDLVAGELGEHRER